MTSNNVYRLRLPWRKPLNELEWMLLRPYVPSVGLRGHIDDAVRRVTVARERREAERERQRVERINRVVVDGFTERRIAQLQGDAEAIPDIG